MPHNGLVFLSAVAIHRVRARVNRQIEMSDRAGELGGMKNGILQQCKTCTGRYRRQSLTG